MADAPETPDAPQDGGPPATDNGSTPPAEQAKPTRTPEDYEAELAKVRREAAGYRVKLKEVEPIPKAAPPPTDRPVEGLRPGATPEPAKPPDDSYPSEWTPSYLRGKEGPSFYG